MTIPQLVHLSPTQSSDGLLYTGLRISHGIATVILDIHVTML